MTRHVLFGSLTRISDLEDRHDFGVAAVDREQWGMGDYVLAEVVEPGTKRRIEFRTGRQAELERGDLMIGALGTRHATLEATGGWRDVGPDLAMHMLTGAGLFGRATSVSRLLGTLTRLGYRGHVMRDETPVRMADFVPEVEPRAYDIPTILIIGTSMSAGKTCAARAVVRLLTRGGMRVAGVKLTGAGRYRDVLSMGDAGADVILDFVDGGLPSSVCEEAVFREAAEHVLSRISAAAVDVAVIEAGASPLEPYNGTAAKGLLNHAVCLTMLAASDPYAVVGVRDAFGLQPDLVTGITANTVAGIELVDRLTGIPAVNVKEPADIERLKGALSEALGADLS